MLIKKKIPNTVLQAILWINLSAFASAIMMSIVRHAAQTQNVVEIIFIRNIFAGLMILPFFIFSTRERFRTDKIKLHMLRSITGVIAMSCFFYCISVMNLSTVTALSFSAPLFTAVMSYFYFKDRFGKHRIIALIIGFIGVLIVLRPGTDAFQPIGLLVVFCGFFWALSGMLIKKLSFHDTPLQITFYMTIFMAIFTLPIMPFVWKNPTYEDLFWICMVAISSNILQFSLAKAFSMANLSVLLPFDYTRLVFAALFAYIIYDEHLDSVAAIGSLVIICASAYTAYREKVNSHKKDHINAL